MKKLELGQKWKTPRDDVAVIVNIYTNGYATARIDGAGMFDVDNHGVCLALGGCILTELIPNTDINARDLTLREFQTRLPWTIRYSNDFRSSPMTHKDFAHTMHHVSKAAGHLHALADDMDHDREIADDSTLRERYAKYVADLVVCALRLANTFPGGVIDLQQATHDRIETKNNVKL